MMRKFLKISIISFAALGLIFFAYVYLASFHPDEIVYESVYNLEEAPLLSPGTPLKIITWNIQFLAGNENNFFFFDGGSDPWPTRETTRKTLSEVVRILVNEDPDIVLLQEVDDGSDRTYNEDQLKLLLDELPAVYGNNTSAFYWKSGYILHPAIFGSAGMKLSILSKYRIAQAIRYALSPITTDNIIVRQFNPKRAMLEAKFPVTDGRYIRIINTHLSAFAQGSDTMEKQIAQVDRLLSRMESKREIGLIGGDFNLIPPGDAYARLSDFNKKYFNPQKSEISVLYDKYLVIPSYFDVNGPDYEKWYTNNATNADPKMPDKTIDYFIFSGDLTPDTSYVRSADTVPISDHLPLIVKLTIPD